jgi:hypothetical protein
LKLPIEIDNDWTDDEDDETKIEFELEKEDKKNRKNWGFVALFVFWGAVGIAKLCGANMGAFNISWDDFLLMSILTLIYLKD